MSSGPLTYLSVSDTEGRAVRIGLIKNSDNTYSLRGSGGGGDGGGGSDPELILRIGEVDPNPTVNTLLHRTKTLNTTLLSLIDRTLSVLSAAQAQVPASIVFDITADPENNLATPTRAIRCETGGTLTVDMVGGAQNVTLRFKDGETRPVQVKRVRSLGAALGVEGMA